MNEPPIGQWEFRMRTGGPINQCPLAYWRLGGKIRKYVSSYSAFRLSFDLHTDLLLVIQMPSF
jgi:hypothetical protein